jgi:hypothetical protein
MKPCPDCDRRAREDAQASSLLKMLILLVLVLAVIVGCEVLY